MRVVTFNKLLFSWQLYRSASLCLLFVCGLGALTVQAAPLADYQQRIARATQLAEEAAAHPPPSDEQIKRLQILKQWLPAQEDIEAAPAQTIRVDNRWLHELLDALSAGTGDRLAQLAELTARLKALHQQLAASANITEAANARAKLDQILAQSEYQRAQQAQPSALKQWVEKVLRGLRDLMRRLFGASSPTPIQPSQGTLGFARVLLILVLALVLLFVLYKFFVWLGGRRRAPTAEKATRQILGEEITEYTTTEDLLASAQMLAQQGDYRAAIRRGYIALLYELEQQGKLRLHQAKTNRDYHDAMRHEQTIYPSFVALTRIFERIWYGHADATQFDFEGFLTGYQKTLNE